MIIELSTASAVTGIGGCTSVQKKGIKPMGICMPNAIAFGGDRGLYRGREENV